MNRLLSIVTPTFNEAENVLELYRRICIAIEPLQKYEFEIIFIDNSSTDKTVEILKEIAKKDKRIKIIINIRNFGHIRSPYWGMMQSSGEATICLASDLQDPPEMIPQFIKQWELGWKIVMAVKPTSKTNIAIHLLRKFYYRILEKISNVPIVKDASGFGLYDCIVIDFVKKINDPYPYLRGMICELGFPIKTIEFKQPRRIAGVSANNFFSLYDIAILGIISHSIMPIRVMGILGFFLSIASFTIGLIYLMLKILYWDEFNAGIVPIIIGVFFMFGLLFIFISLIGEYIGSIHTYLRNRPIVVEKERINFD